MYQLAAEECQLTPAKARRRLEQVIELFLMTVFEFIDREVTALRDYAGQIQDDELVEPERSIIAKINEMICSSSMQRKVAYQHAREHLLEAVRAFVAKFELDVELPKQ